MSLQEHWVGHYKALGDQHRTFVVPYRYGDAGWFDYQPMSPIYPVVLWSLSMAAGDWERIEEIRRQSLYDWNRVFGFHTKEDAGHEQPWVRFAAGANPTYPEEILGAAYSLVSRRLSLIRADQEMGTRHHVHRWQQTNPITTEALIQLTTGAPQMIYNGGLLMAQLRYFDSQRRRPGLPEDVAALVEKLESQSVVLRLVNLSPFESRRAVVQAGTFGEHRFTRVHYNALTSDYPGPLEDYAVPDLNTEKRTAAVEAMHLEVELPPATEIALELGMERFVNTPSYALPWD
jgi:hypothetical protein